MKNVLRFVLVFLALAVTGVCDPSPVLDNNIVGKRLMAAQKAYEVVRDQVIAVQDGEVQMSTADLAVLVQTEADLATKSWVRAAIYCYLGAMREQLGDAPGAIKAYKTASKYGKTAMKFTNDPDEAKVKQSQEEGLKYRTIADKALKRLIKAKVAKEEADSE